MNLQARIYRYLIFVFGVTVFLQQWRHEQTGQPALFLLYLGLSLLSSFLRVGVPTIAGTMSINFLFILAAIGQLSTLETMSLAVASTLMQCVRQWRAQREWAPMIFQSAVVVLGVEAASVAYRRAMDLSGGAEAVALPLTATVLFLVTAFPLAALSSLAEKRRLREIWQSRFLWSLPYYLAGASIAGLLTTIAQVPAWLTCLMLAPVLLLIYRAYVCQIERLDRERREAEELTTLQLGMVEALALAIEAKDSQTHDHLRRVMTYVGGIGREMGLKPAELQALRAAALLHDIGKLAVPDHIISKPGRLTPDEFERLKVHPMVGAEIIERARFPYPVAPIVRAHHEKWDGSGYPHGLRGEEIPLGARILAAVDCLDALSSDRQYRRALPLDQALQKIRAEAGRSFDPRVVEILMLRHKELEAEVAKRTETATPLPVKFELGRNVAPAAGYEQNQLPDESAEPPTFLETIAAARREEQLLLDLTQSIGSSLNLSETVTAMAKRLEKLVPFETIVLYGLHDDVLTAEHIHGQNYRFFAGIKVPIGEGLSGWVAGKRKPIVNGNPRVEPGYRENQAAFGTLASALAVPLESAHGVIGVLAFYSSGLDAYTRDHLRLLLAISPKLALTVENSLKYRQAQSMASVDFLTGLPNAGSLFVHLQSELNRTGRSDGQLSVLVCDLDGFKSVNDRFGHLTGNKVLQLVAQGFREYCREYDFVARMGGDEFVLVLPGLSSDAVRTKRKRLSQIVTEAGRTLCGEDLLSLSVGEARFPQDGSSAEKLLACADERMYQHKQDRRFMSPSDRRDTAHNWFEASAAD